MSLCQIIISRTFRDSCESWFSPHSQMKSQSVQKSSSTSFPRALWSVTVQSEWNGCPGFRGRSRCCWLVTLYQSPHEEPPLRSSTHGEYRGINPDGTIFAVGLTARRTAREDWTCVGLQTEPIKCPPDSVVFAPDGIAKCDGRSPVNRWPPLLSCVGCLGECAATAFCCFSFFFFLFNCFCSNSTAFVWFVHFMECSSPWTDRGLE